MPTVCLTKNVNFLWVNGKTRKSLNQLLSARLLPSQDGFAVHCWSRYFCIADSMQANIPTLSFYRRSYTDKKKFWNVLFRKRQLKASEMKRSVLETKSFHLHVIRFRPATKPVFLIMKYHISLSEWLVSLPIWNESRCKWTFFVLKTIHSIWERATSCFLGNRAFQNFFISALTPLSFTLLYNRRNFYLQSYIHHETFFRPEVNNLDLY